MYGLVLTGVACGGGSSTPTAPTPPPTQAPTTPPTPPPAPPAAVSLASFLIGVADGVMPGQNTGGRVALSGPAPAGGVVIDLSKSNPQAAIAPSSVTIPAGATSVELPILTSTVSSNVTVTMTASAGGISIPSTLPIAPGPFLSFTSSPGDAVGLGRSRRFTTTDMGFSAQVTSELSSVLIIGNNRTTSGQLYLSLRAPSGFELRAGTYSNATASGSSTLPGLQFSAFGRTCGNATGQFVITDIAFGPTPNLQRLAATFIQQCGSSLLLGEVLAHP